MLNSLNNIINIFRCITRSFDTRKLTGAQYTPVIRMENFQLVKNGGNKHRDFYIIEHTVH